MRWRRITRVGIAAAFAVLLVPVAAGAQEPPPGDRRPDRAHVDRARLGHVLDQVSDGLTTAAGSPGSGVAARPPDDAGRVPVVVEGGDRALLEHAVEGAGGRVGHTLPGAVTAVVAPEQLSEVGRSPGVTAAWIDQTPISDDVSEGTRPTAEQAGATNASLWHGDTPPQRGAGVKIGIIDIGFRGFNTLPIPGDRPPADRVFSDNLCEPLDMFGAGVTNHGAAVTEIAYDMAPDATFYLVCIDLESDLGAAVDFLALNGVTIVNMSLSFTQGRGDGSSFSSLHAAAVVQRARSLHGILWFNSAGNRGESHYAVTAGDNDGNFLVEITPAFPEAPEFFLFGVPPSGEATVDVRWDAWFGTAQNYSVELWDFTVEGGEFRVDLSNNPQPGSPPWETVSVANPRPSESLYALLVVRNGAAAAPRRFNFFFFGDFTGFDDLTPAGSITEPSTSPYTMAVGAHCFRGTATEPFSSRGPTIDGRIKPDISGPDGVSTMTFGAAPATCDGASGFFGTSASAPHAAGAAALLKGANPTLDVAELQALVEAYANGTVALDPQGQNNVNGFGQLTLPVTPATPQPPAGQLYTGINPPTRIMDTRPGPGCRPGPCTPLGPGQTRNLPIHSLTEVPDDASAVVLNVTAVGPTAASHLTVFPTGQPVPTVANLNFTAGQVVGNHVTATIGAGGQISIFNNSGQVHVVVDLAGFYAPSGTVGLVALDPPGRIMDTRPASCTGPRCTRLGPGETMVLPVHGVDVGDAIIPGTAQAVVLNVTGVLPTAATHITIWPDGPNPPTVASLNLAPGVVRGNLVVATIGTDGAIRIRNNSGQVDLVADVFGWFEPSGARYVALPPRRTLDTRTGNGPRFGPLTAGEQYDHQTQFIYSVPDDATAALMNVTVVAPSGNGHLTIFPDGAPAVPTSANVNFLRGQVVPNAVISGIGETGEVGQPTGQITIFNNPSSSATPVVVDLAGYFVP